MGLKMVIKKIYNNNIVLVEDRQQLEMILIGKGLAFGKKAGDKVDARQAEKRFVIDSPELTSRFTELMGEVPANHLELTWQIIKEAQEFLKVTFSDAIYVALTDHINYALYRSKQELPLKNNLLWEIKRFYPKEYEAAKKSIKTIAYYENIWLPEDEAGYIALHFVNATQSGEGMETTILATKTVQETLRIIQIHFNLHLDEESLDYQRLVTHVRYFVHRVLAGELADSDDDTLYEQVKAVYPRCYSCVFKIHGYFFQKFETNITNEEKMYLMLHIGRVIRREDIK